jgi:hypothetical protein
MSDLNLGSITPINDFPSPDKPTWNNPSNLVDGKLPGGTYSGSKTSVPDYPRHAREIQRPISPLLSWYAGALPPNCIISHGVVTSDNVKHDATQS